MAQTVEEELSDKVREVRFATAVSSVSIVRYLTDAVLHLPISAVSRLLQTHDLLSALLPLAERPPWVRAREAVSEAFDGSAWRTVPPSERFRLSSQQAQVRG